MFIDKKVRFNRLYADDHLPSFQQMRNALGLDFGHVRESHVLDSIQGQIANFAFQRFKLRTSEDSQAGAGH